MKWIHKRTIFQEAGVIISKSIRPSPGELHRRLRVLLYHRREGMERGGGGRWTGLTARGLWWRLTPQVKRGTASPQVVAC